jgi:hypothetical protein
MGRMSNYAIALQESLGTGEPKVVSPRNRRGERLMHTPTLVILGDAEYDTSPPDIVSGVAEALEPTGDGLKWDWYQIGGRWTGLFDGYRPDDDSKLMETCTWCDGTGKRNDSRCNGCDGTGKRTKWPTDWPIRPMADSIPCAKLTQDHLDTCCAVVVNGYWHSSERYEPWQGAGSMLQPQEMPPVDWLQTIGLVAVIVDCHN